MNDAHQTPLEEAISFLTIAAILVAVGCYAAAVQNIPVASPALFWVASMVYHWFPVLNAIRAPQMPIDASRLKALAEKQIEAIEAQIVFDHCAHTWRVPGHSRRRASSDER